MNIKLLITLVVTTCVGIGVVHYKNKPLPQIPFLSPVKTQPQTPKPKELTFEDALNSIKQDDMKKDLYFLCSNELEGRMSGKNGNKLAANYIKERFEILGLKTKLQQFPIKQVNPGPKNEVGDAFTSNVIGWLEGTQLKDEVIVISSHFDHIGYGPRYSLDAKREIHPGADDNGSGTVGVMAIAKAASLIKNQKRTVAFICFSAEEMGLLGSEFYCNRPILPENGPSIKKHVFNCNLDMIGYLHQANPSYAIYSETLGQLISELNGKYNFAQRITSTTGRGGSDHASFHNKGVPTAFLFTGLHKNYHTVNDTPDKINYNGLEQITKYAFELYRKIDQQDKLPKLTDFNEIESDKDHETVKFD